MCFALHRIKPRHHTLPLSSPGLFGFGLVLNLNNGHHLRYLNGIYLSEGKGLILSKHKELMKTRSEVITSAND